MSLQSIAQTLYNQAGSGTVTLNDSLFGSGNAFLSLVQQSLLFPAGEISLSVSQSVIPQNPAGSSFSFPAALPPVSFLNLSGNLVTATISEVTDGSDTFYQLQLAIDLTQTGSGDSNWIFSTSFPSLLGWPFDALPLQAQQFIFVFGQYDLPAGLSEGLNFNSSYTLTGILVPMLQVLQTFGNSAPEVAPLAGLIVQTPNGPVFALQSNITNASSINLQAFTVAPPVLKVYMSYIQSSDNPQTLTPWGDIVLTSATTLSGQEDPVNVSFLLPYYSSSANAISVIIAPEPGTLSTSISSLGEWMAGKTWDKFFAASPANLLQPYLNTFGLQSYEMCFTLSTFSVLSTTLNVGTLAPWTIIENKLVMTNFSVGWQVIDPFGDPNSSVSVVGTLEMFGGTGDALVFTGAINLPGLHLSMALSSETTMTAAQWLQTIVTQFGGGTLPAEVATALSAFNLDIMLFSMDVPDQSMVYALSGNLVVGGKNIDFNIYLSIGLSPQFNYDIAIEFVLGGAEVRGEITNQGGNTVITCSWEDDVSPLLISDIASSLGYDHLGIPEELEIYLKRISVVYDVTDSIFTITGDSENYGKAVLAIFEPEGTTTYALYAGLNVDRPVDLTSLPLVGKALSLAETAKIDKLKILITSSVITDPQQIDQLNGLIGELGADYPVIPDQGMAATVNISMELDIGGFIIPLGTGAGGKTMTDMPAKRSSVQGEPQGNASVPVTSTPGSLSDGTTWFNVQKAIGPVMFRRIGVRYQKSALWFLLDATFSTGGLTVELEGMSINMPLDSFEPVFTLTALGMDYDEPGLEIGGAFYKVAPSEGEEWKFAGGAVITAGSFSMNAMGSYASVYAGGTIPVSVPSMFVFGQVTGAFGGPPAFFITGLEAGFGYNSSLRIPGMNELYQFPLLAGAQDPARTGGKAATPEEVLRVLLGINSGRAWITQEVGQYWLAAGLQISTFSLVNTNALVTAEFGKQLRFALLGLSRARFPREGRVTYAFIELQVRTVVDPGEGMFGLSAVLSPNSYLLDPTCKITGGFAFYGWYAPSEHAGDFVITIGGYHPAFDPPLWYPDVPRVGFSWSLDASTSITGMAYFAMTPSAIMAGGQLSVTYQSGNLKAWFRAWANMLLYWNPFHFDVEIGVTVGASYKLDLWFTTVTLEAELGASLHLWGPATGGTVTVHWSVISFTVPFGAPSSGEVHPLSWAEFEKQLPERKDILRIVPAEGLVSNGTTDLHNGIPWIVRPSGFSISITSAVPNSELLLGSAGTSFQEGNMINIRPMQDYRTGNSSKGKNLVSQQTLIVYYNGTEINLQDPNACWNISAHKQNVPKALWGTGPQNQLSEGDDQMVMDQLVGFDLASPDTTLGNSPGAIDVANNLSYDDLEDAILPVQEGVSPKGAVPEEGTNTILTIEQEIAADTDTVTARSNLFNSLAGFGVDPGTNDDMTAYANAAGAIFIDEPMIIPTTTEQI